jgi:hypothetical protein
LDGIEGSTDLWAATGDHIEEYKQIFIIILTNKAYKLSLTQIKTRSGFGLLVPNARSIMLE